MKGSIESLAAKLERELDTGSVRCEPDDLRPFSVDAIVPSILCLPSNVDQISTALRILSEAGASVIPWGGGTSMGMGNLPRGLDVVIGRSGEIVSEDENGRQLNRYMVPYGANLKVKDGKSLAKGEIIFEWDPYNMLILAEKSGTVKYSGIKEKETVREEYDEARWFTRKEIEEGLKERPEEFNKCTPEMLANYG